MRHVVLEGLPAVGKSETLALLARFYPERVKILPELVKQVVTREEIDLLRERKRLTDAIIAELPRRRHQIEDALAQGKLCLEESHMGVHLAYSQALGDQTFIDVDSNIQDSLPTPDLYLQLEIPIDLSLTRQHARVTPNFDVQRSTLEGMLTHLQAWHITQGSNVVTVNADRSPATFLAEVEDILGLSYTAKPSLLEDTFDILFLLGRPASGKSEFMDFMAKCSLDRRAQRYHIAPFHVIDDFPILWEKFEEDDLWERLGRKRLYSKSMGGNYAVVDDGLWSFLTGKIDRQLAGLLADPDTLSRKSLFVEFSRGKEHGYSEALSQLSEEILSRAAILYICVSFEESYRKNLIRYDEKKRDGILTHSVPHGEMKQTYRDDDWFDLTSTPHGTLDVNGIPVPYVTMKNEPESTDLDVLDARYKDALDRLYALWRESRK